MLREKRVIITGSEGFVGSYLRSKLAEEGVEVIPIDISIGLDITDWEQLRDFGQNADIIIHLAARTYIPTTSANPRDTYHMNLNGTLNMLELARRNGIRKFVYASAYVYGIPQYLPIDEKHPINPINPYNRSKALGEELCHAYYEDHGLECVILRAFNIYGKGQNKDFLIPSIVNQINQKEIILNDPKPKRDFIHVEDVVDAYIKAAQYSGSACDVFNIGSGNSFSVDEIAQKIIAVSGRTVKVNYLDQQRKNEIADTVADITRAKEELNWEPKTTMDEGLGRCL